MKKKVLVFTLCASFMVLSILGCGSSSSTSTSKSGTTTVKTESNTTETSTVEKENKRPEIKEYKIGDVINVETEYGSYEFAITGVKETDERNEFYTSFEEGKEQPKRVVLISYEYKNIDYYASYDYTDYVQDEISINDYDFDVYDAEGNRMDTYPATLDFGSGVTAGHKATGTMAYGLNSDENFIEMEYNADWLSATTCKIILEW